MPHLPYLEWVGRNWLKLVVSLLVLWMLLTKATQGAHLSPLIIFIVVGLVIGQLLVYYTRLKSLGWVVTLVFMCLGTFWAFTELHPYYERWFPETGGVEVEPAERSTFKWSTAFAFLATGAIALVVVYGAAKAFLTGDGKAAKVAFYVAMTLLVIGAIGYWVLGPELFTNTLISIQHAIQSLVAGGIEPSMPKIALPPVTDTTPVVPAPGTDEITLPKITVPSDVAEFFSSDLFALLLILLIFLAVLYYLPGIVGFFLALGIVYLLLLLFSPNTLEWVESRLPRTEQAFPTRGETLYDGGVYTLTNSQWLVLGIPEDQCIAVEPSAGVHDMRKGDNYLLRSFGAEMEITAYVLDPGQTLGSYTCPNI